MPANDCYVIPRVKEFRAAALVQRQQMLHALLEPVFTHLDVDKTGKITPSEMVRVFDQLGVAELQEAQVAEMMRSYDTSKTGSLNFTEFKSMIMSASNRSPLLPRQSP